METTLTLKELHDAYLALAQLGNQEGLKAGPSFMIASTLRRWKPDYDGFVEKQQALYEKYGERQKLDDGSDREYMMIPPEVEPEFRDEINPLLNLPVSVSITTHPLIFFGEKVSAAIEPELIHRLRFLLERPASDPASPQKLMEQLSNSQVEEALRALSAIATYKMPETLAWWFADFLGEVVRLTDMVYQRRWELLRRCPVKNGVRELTADYKAANLALGMETSPVMVTPLSIAALGDLVEKWPPTMLVPIIFAFYE